MLCQGGQPSRWDGDRASSSFPPLAHLLMLPTLNNNMLSSTRRRSSFLANSLVCSAFYPNPISVLWILVFGVKQLFFFFWPAWCRTIWLRRAENGNIKVFVSCPSPLDCTHKRPGLIKRGPSFSQISCVFCTYIYPVLSVAVRLEPVPAIVGWRQGTTLKNHQFTTGLTTASSTQILAGKCVEVMSRMRAFCLCTTCWKKSGWAKKSSSQAATLTGPFEHII